MTARNGSLIFFLLFFLSLPSLSAQQDIRISGTFEPAVITQGEYAEYRIVISGFKGGRVIAQIPKPTGLELVSRSESQSFNFSNGVQTIEKIFSRTYAVSDTGYFTIPSYEIQFGGDTYIVPSATLQVVERRTPQGIQRGQSQGASTDDDGALAPMIELLKPRENLYVGESAFSQIKIYVPDPLRWRSPVSVPVKEGDAFSVNGLNQRPRVSEADFSGQYYRVMNFPVIITPLKSGEQMLNFNYQLATVEPLRNSRGFTDPWGDSFFGSMMTPTRSRSHNLVTGPEVVNVLPLPAEGQPDSFTGAIGDFDASWKLSHKMAKVGEPVTINIKIVGQGNFSRMEAPQLPLRDSWKVYEPKVSFSDSDGVGYSGAKTFEYVLSPNEPGNLQIGPLYFSYFDPTIAEYRAVELAPHIIEVTGKALPLTSESSGQSDMPEERVEEEPRDSTHIAIRRKSGGASSANTPLILQSWFLVLQAVLALVSVSAYVLIKRKRRIYTDSDYAHKVKLSKQTRDALKESRQKQSDATAFYEAACNAIRAAVAAHDKREPAAITLSDVEEWMKKVDATVDLLQEAQRFFEAADSLKYGGGADQPYDGAGELARLEKVIEGIQDPSKDF